MDSILKKCRLCPRRCGADRTAGGRGFCGAGSNIKTARIAPHYWEEPCISGKNGSGTVFFSYCTLRCVYCQNYEISTCGKGVEITPEALAWEMLKLRDEGVNNINLVTPTHFVPQIIQALDAAKAHGLDIPILYNTSGYENVETLRMLDGYIDIYMPDMKYYSDKYALKYSSVPDYFEVAKKAVAEMVRQTGKNVFNAAGIMTKGTLIRHLVLPGLLLESKRIMDYLFDTYGDSVYISLMCQYTPLMHVKDYPELNRKINMRAYDTLVDYCARRGMEQVYIQSAESAKESFIPAFEGE